MAALLQEPNWTQAAQALVDGCVDLPNDEDRVALLAAVCEGLGDELYPALLRVLSVIGERGDHSACEAVARALVHALRTGRLPSGRRSAWGASMASPAQAAFGRSRSLGPIEYLCAWHAQAEPAQALSAAHFQAAARSVMELISCSREARLLYCEKLLADVDDPIAGAMTRQTRHALRSMATAWASGAAPVDAAARFLAELSASAARAPGSTFGLPAGGFR